MSNSPQAAQRRVVITGVGIVCPLGSSPEAYASALAEGKSGVTRRGAAMGAPRAGGFADGFTGGIDDFGDLDGDRKKAIRKGLKLMCRETQMAVAAAQHALRDAGDLSGADPERSGVVLGSDYMLTLPEDYADAIARCCEGGAFDFAKWGAAGLGEMQPLWMLKYLPNMPASHIAIYNDLRGPNNSLTLREAGGLAAVGEAARIVARGDADQMLAGATGTNVLPMQAVHALQRRGAEPPVVADDPEGTDPATLSRPFDRARRGMVCGEGAGVVMLESLESAERRGARVYGEVVGFASSLATNRKLEGDNAKAIASAIRGALADAGLAPSDLGHVNADGLGTPQADRDEAAAIRAALGEAADTTPVVALKSYYGALGAGGGVVELVASLLAMDPAGPLAAALPRTLNLENPDPECPVNAVSEPGVAAGGSFVAVNATPQGQAVAVCVRRAG